MLHGFILLFHFSLFSVYNDGLCKGTSGGAMAVFFQTVILIHNSSVLGAANHLSTRWHSRRDRQALWKCSSLGSHHSVWKKRLMPTALSDGDGYTVCSLCPAVTELCLISADSSFYDHWGSCIYALQRIWPFCLSHDAPHHGRNAVLHHQILKFRKWAVTNWTDQGETVQSMGETQETKHPLLPTAVYLCFIKSRIHKREPYLCLCALLLLFGCCQSNIAALLHYATTVSSQSPSSD